jgi:hypothetical protein
MTCSVCLELLKFPVMLQYGHHVCKPCMLAVNTCRMELRAPGLMQLLSHVDSATQVSALESGRAPERKVDAWMRGHG